MIGGQVLDTCHPEQAKAGGSGTLSDLQRIHRMKTGALIRCACRMGGLCADSSGEKLKLVDAFGRAIGLAFQIVDDILDVTATQEQMGKKTGKDAAIGKLTYPVLVGLDKSREFLTEQVKIAESVADKLGGAGAPMITQIVHELASRTN
jgi:geranylgeranyl diphosphate synthase type II